MKDFVPYQPSLDMKELGFDEPCIGYHHNHVEFSFVKDLNRGNTTKNSEQNLYSSDCAAPTFSQAFRWFRDKYNLVHEISRSKYKGGLNFNYDIFSLVLPTDAELGDENNIASDKSMETYDSYFDYYFLVDKDFRHHESNTYEEAELACLIKLIEIVKEKK